MAFSWESLFILFIHDILALSMFRFFRRLRRKLVESGKIRNYLAYAVGEILLVVIGILIALQINNWNTRRQEQQELKGFISNISNNIRSDLDELRALMPPEFGMPGFDTNELYFDYNWTRKTTQIKLTRALEMTLSGKHSGVIFDAPGI